MSKITSVEPQKRNPKRFNIFLDGEFAFGADEDLVVNRRLVVGKEIKVEDLEQILFEAEVGKLMERMYRLFNIRQRSERETRDYFRKLNIKNQISKREKVSDLVIDNVIETLKKKGMIDDEQFARSWADARSKKYGSRRIKQELFQKGIDREIIERVKEGIPDSVGTEESNVAEVLLEKKLRIWKNLSALEFKKKALEFLMRKGFEYSVARDVVEKIMKK